MTSPARPAPPSLDDARRQHVAGRIDLAARTYRRILIETPDTAEALHLLGTALMQGGQPDRAHQLLERALRCNGQHSGSWNNLGLVRRAMGRPDAAIRALRHTLALQPTHLDALGNLAVTQRLSERTTEAVRWLRRGVALAPDTPVTRNELALTALGTPTAVRLLQQAAALDPAYGDAWYHLGLSRQPDDPQAAERHYRRAVTLLPEFRDGWLNRGAALIEVGRTAAAQACYARALALLPSHPGTLNNIGHELRKRNQVVDALAVYDRAIRSDPTLPDSVYNRGLARFLVGDFDGAADYEARWQVKGFPSQPRTFAQPLWDGRPLQGRTLLLHAEQGFGDTLQFVRYAPWLTAARDGGGRVLLEAPAALLALLAGVPGIDRVIGPGETLPPFDCHAPLLSLPLLCGTRLDTIPATIPYLTPPPDRAPPATLAGAEPDGRRRVGVVWRGSPTHRNDRNRSLTRAALEPLLAVPGVRFVSLQLERKEENDPLEDVTGGIRDFADTAALVQALDLVIAVDTSVAHLAGALGRPVWVMLPFAPDWRWMLEREDSPWYPTMRLFRQTAPGDWDGVIARVADALTRLVDGRPTAALVGNQAATNPDPNPDSEIDRAMADQALNAATALHQAGRVEEAEAAYRALLARHPRHTTGWNNLGILLRGAGRLDEADGCFRQQIAADPEQPKAWVNLAVSRRDSGRTDDANRFYHRALALAPAHPQALYNHGNLRLADAPAEAERQYRRAARLPTEQDDLYHNLAGALERRDRIDDALRIRRRALALNPLHIDGWGQMAKDLLERNRVDDALVCSHRGLRIEPDHPILRYNRSLTMMLSGRLREAWPEYEWRWETQGFSSLLPRTTRPRWRGESLTGKTILLHSEQGFGDGLQFLRYLPLVLERAERVLLAIPPETAGLIPASDRLELLRNGQPMPVFDVWCPLLSLPLAFDQAGVEAPDLPFLASQVPYLHADPDRCALWADRLRSEPGDLERPETEQPGGAQPGTEPPLRVGLVWAGNPKHANDARRSFSPATLKRLVERLGAVGAGGLQLHFLQVGDRAGDPAAVGVAGAGRDLAPWLTDYADTAAALMTLDLVIAVDTSVAHLAGALGRPVWVMLPFAPDWRWMLEREDSPWYPTMRLFRQPAPGDWDGVIARVADALAQRHRRGLGPPERIDPNRLRAQADALLHARRIDAAQEGWRRLAAFRPDDADAWSRLDVLAFQQRNLTEAIRCARRSLRLAPDNPTEWSNLGAYERRAGRLARALDHHRRAAALHPAIPDVMNNLANGLGSLRAWTAALTTARRVIRLVPGKADAHHNHAILLKETGRVAASVDGFRMAQRLQPGYVEARFHEALSLLLLSRFDEGWEAYESRWDQPHCKERRRLAAPQWRGGPLEGKTILIHAEQGFGDSFQFLRYLPLVRDRGARVLAVMQPELGGMVARMGAVDRMIASGEPLPSFDLHCPLLSLPLAFGTGLDSVPAAVPYLQPDPARRAAWAARVADRLGDGGMDTEGRRLRVGLVWAGRPTHGNDANRSLALTALAPLARAAGDRVAWITLQKGEAAQQADHPPAGFDLWNLDSELQDFEDTAAALMELDLVITVDTSVAHLAGALGRPVWVLLPFHPDWRWMLEREDSPWYPTMRLFRQPAPGDWTAAIGRVARALGERVNEPTNGTCARHPDPVTAGVETA